MSTADCSENSTSSTASASDASSTEVLIGPEGSPQRCAEQDFAQQGIENVTILEDEHWDEALDFLEAIKATL